MHQHPGKQLIFQGPVGSLLVYTPIHQVEIAQELDNIRIGQPRQPHEEERVVLVLVLVVHPEQTTLKRSPFEFQIHPRMGRRLRIVDLDVLAGVCVSEKIESIRLNANRHM